MTQTLLPLQGGTSAGALTGLGREQTYLLGRRLKDKYKQALDISTFDPKEIRYMYMKNKTKDEKDRAHLLLPRCSIILSLKVI